MNNRNKLPSDVNNDETAAQLMYEQALAESEFLRKKLQLEKIISRARTAMSEAKAEYESNLNRIKQSIIGYVNRLKSTFVKPKSRKLKFGEMIVGRLGIRQEGGAVIYSKSNEEIIQQIKLHHPSKVGLLINTTESLKKGELKKLLVAGTIELEGVKLSPKEDIAFYEVIHTPDHDV